MNHLQSHGISAPLNVYRDLDALESQGKVHRIESLNGFIACSSCDNEAHSTFFILCQSCDASEEIYDPKINVILDEWFENINFSVTKQTT